jgi:flagellar protein FlbD
MIKVTKINGEPLVVNALLIEAVESTPDTMITLTTGRKIMVRDGIDEVVNAAAAYHHAVGLQPSGNGDHGCAE